MSTPAEDAYRAAEEEIARVKAEGETALDLGKERHGNLEKLPDAIGDLLHLEWLALTNTNVKDITCLGRLRDLKALSLVGTHVVDLQALSQMQDLEVLDASNTAVDDLAALLSIKSLRMIGLRNTLVKDLRPIANQRWVDTLSIDRTLVDDLTVLLDVPGFLNSRAKTPTQIFSLVMKRTLSGPSGAGLTFKGCSAAKRDPTVAEIANIEDNVERARTLFDYLEDRMAPRATPREPIEQLLKGPILSDTLAEIEEQAAQFHATSLEDEPSKPLDRRHDELVGALGYVTLRLSQAEVENRIGREVRQSLRDYHEFLKQTPLNGRVLRLLAEGARAVMASPDAREALDGFDTSSLTSFLSEHDALIQEYHRDALQGASFEADADPQVLVQELPKRLLAAKSVLDFGEDEGLFAPTVSTALEALERREEGERRGYMLATTDEERAARGKALNRLAVQITAYLGRIKARLLDWQSRTKTWTKTQVDYARDNPGQASANATAAVVVGREALGIVTTTLERLTPIFEAIWKMISNMPLPF